MKKLSLAICAATSLAAGALTPDDAHAWLEFENSTNTTVNVAHAFDSIHGAGGFCGYFDGCSASGTAAWRVEHWWVLAPGGDAIVQSEDYENAKHQFYAFSVQGHVWTGSGNTFKMESSAGSHCGNKAFGTAYTFRVLTNNRCCGVIDCAGGNPANYTVFLTL